MEHGGSRRCAEGGDPQPVEADRARAGARSADGLARRRPRRLGRADRRTAAASSSTSSRSTSSITRATRGRARSTRSSRMRSRRRDTPRQRPALDPRGLTRAARPLRGPRPGCSTNLLRIDHLDREAAREAIERPLEQWNRVEAAPGEQVEIEPALVEAVLDAGRDREGPRRRAAGAGGRQGERGRRSDGSRRRTSSSCSRGSGTRSERLGSRVLRLATLEHLGGAERIVRTHLDATMGELPQRRAGRRGAGASATS